MPARRRAAAAVALAAACHLAVLGGPGLETAYAQPPPPAPAAPPAKSATTALIQRGSALFDDQAYEESIQTLSAALVRPGATDAEKIEIYRLLAYNFIILKRNDEADAAVRGIFVVDESFALAPSESPRFRDFFAATKKKWTDEGKPGKAVVGAPPPVEKPIKMTHASPAEAKDGSALKLSGQIEDPDARVRGVQLAYRTGAKGKFVTVAATYTLGEFHATIPGNAVKPPLVEYYVSAIDKGGLPLTSRGDAGNPLRVVVPKDSSVVASPALWVPLGVAVAAGAAVGIFFLTRSKSSTGVTQTTVMVGVHE
jgi:hypothetical protein